MTSNMDRQDRHASDNTGLNSLVVETGTIKSKNNCTSFHH